MIQEQKTSTKDAPGANLEKRILTVGHALSSSIWDVAQAVPKKPKGPAELARILGIDKVLASRVLKATKNKDPIAALHMMPGPEPLRRFIKAAGKQGVDSPFLQKARTAVDDFESLIREGAGDRSALDAIISAWLPEARVEFELRRKQTAYRAMSELKGVSTNIILATTLLHPSADGEHLDVVWLFGFLGLKRLRPGAAVKFASRRFAQEGAPRLPQTLDGVPVEGLEGLRLNEFCSMPLADLEVVRAGDVTHYTMAENGFGPRSASDLIFAEVNLNEMARYIPHAQKRKRHVFAENSIPSKVLVFDALLHEDVFPGLDPSLMIYDTVLEGVADINDPGRDIDRLDLCETIQNLGMGIIKFRSSDVPRYAELLHTVCDKLGWDATRFRGYRCKVDYPIYGSQVAMTWDSTPPPGE